MDHWLAEFRWCALAPGPSCARALKKGLWWATSRWCFIVHSRLLAMVPGPSLVTHYGPMVGLCANEISVFKLGPYKPCLSWKTSTPTKHHADVPRRAIWLFKILKQAWILYVSYRLLHLIGNDLNCNQALSDSSLPFLTFTSTNTLYVLLKHPQKKKQLFLA